MQKPKVEINYPPQLKAISIHAPHAYAISSWTKIFTVIASEAKQSQPLRLRHSAPLHSQ
ncbi:MAG: hypothetical protein AAF630_12605 [Cyanobacteria bacterium P01_C01_bin.38]